MESESVKAIPNEVIKTDKPKCLFGEFAPPKDFKPLTALDKCEEENLEAIIEDLLFTNTYILLHGAKESFKSWLAAYIAICVAKGKPCFGKKVRKRGKVVYAYGEGAMKKRLKALCRGMGIRVPKNIYPYRLRTDLSAKDAQTDLLHHIPEGTVLIIIDNYEKYWWSSMEEKVVDSAIKFMQTIREHATVLLIQHHPKNAPKNATGHKLAIGSVRIVNAADSTFSLKLNKKIATCEIYHREAEAPTDLNFMLTKLHENAFKLDDMNALLALPAQQKVRDGCLRLVEDCLGENMRGMHSKTAIYKTFLKGRNISGLSADGFYNRIFPALVRERSLVEIEKGKYEFRSKRLPEASEK